MSTFTANKNLEQPPNGADVNTWNVPVNNNSTNIDQAFGGVTYLNATSGSATLTTTQYLSLGIDVTGSITGDVTYTIPSGVGGQWIVYNGTTGGHNVIIAYAGGGPTVSVPAGTRTIVFCDTNISPATYGVYPAINVNNIIGNLSVSGNTYVSGSMNVGSSNQGYVYADGSYLYLRGPNILFQNSATATLAIIDSSGNFTATGNVTAYSDQRLKNDIKTIEDALDKVRKLRGVSYVNANTGEPSIGVIAQEVKEVIPEVVQDNGGLLSVAYGNLVGVLIEAVKELSAKVDALESK
jgi:Chaperone of endosialidase